MSMRNTGLAGGAGKGLSCPLDSTQYVSTVMHQFAESLGAAIDAKDPNTSRHSDEVAEVSHALALTMGLSPREADVIHVAAHLHDIGKIGVPDAVLSKQGALTTSEWQAIRKHPEMGAAILKPVASLRDLGVVGMVLHHHERWDGKGYPNRLKGAHIPLGARIICLGDSLSAMLQKRPYRKAMDYDKAYEEVISCSGTQFDPSVVAAFKKTADTVLQMVSFLTDKEQVA